MLPLNENKTHKYIDRLLSEGKEDEAIQLIEEAWKKEVPAEKEIIIDINQRLNAFEKNFAIKK